MERAVGVGRHAMHAVFLKRCQDLHDAFDKPGALPGSDFIGEEKLWR